MNRDEDCGLWIPGSATNVNHGPPEACDLTGVVWSKRCSMLHTTALPNPFFDGGFEWFQLHLPFYLVCKKWLDVGTGIGGILDLLKNSVSEIVAVEPQRAIRKKLRDAYNQARSFLALSTGYLQECLNGVKTVQLYSAEKEVFQKFSGHTNAFFQAQKKSLKK